MTYLRAAFGLLTKHRKEGAFQSRFAAAFDAKVVRVDGFDTDALGTFTRDVPREGSQLEAARRKATLAIALGGQARGLGSEGSFAAGPFGIGAWDVEMVCLVDGVRGIEIVGRASAFGRAEAVEVRSTDEVPSAAARCGFPEHGIVVRPASLDDSRFEKDVTPEALLRTYENVRRRAENDLVFFETDLRAHRNPTRMQTIARAVDDLVLRMQTNCEGCGSPGFGVERRLPGLPCEACGEPTDDARATLFACVACDFRAERPVDEDTTTAARCARCNP